MKRTPRQPANLRDSVRHQLNMYSIAASAAGITALALAQPAEAKIVYTKTHDYIGLNQAYQLDLNHDGIVDFLILRLGTSRSNFGFLLTKEAFGNAVQGSWVCGSCRYSSNGFPLDFALKGGAQIGSKQGFIECSCPGETMAKGQVGYWFDVKDRYLGLKFQIDGETHYGWARLSVESKSKPQLTALITGYAYETTPEKGILAGQADDDDAVGRVPAGPADPQDTVVKKAKLESTSLGALALGAQGVADRRNQ